MADRGRGSPDAPTPRHVAVRTRGSPAPDEMAWQTWQSSPDTLPEDAPLGTRPGPPCQYAEPKARRSSPCPPASSCFFGRPSLTPSPSPTPCTASSTGRLEPGFRPSSPACWPIFILRPGKDSWAPGLQLPRLKPPLGHREGPQTVPGRSLPGDATPRVCARPPAIICMFTYIHVYVGSRRGLSGAFDFLHRTAGPPPSRAILCENRFNLKQSSRRFWPL